MLDILIVGAGASGLMAAAALSEKGFSGEIWEKMPRPGLKILITGKGRCNITNARYSSLADFLSNYTQGGRFLYSAMTNFSPEDTLAFFKRLGLEYVLEQGGRVFPATERAQDVLEVLLKASKTSFSLKQEKPVTKITPIKGGFLVESKNDTVKTKTIVLAVGGASYPLTGSSGDGVKLLKPLGHSFAPLKPGLVPLESSTPFIKSLQGLSLVNVKATLLLNGKKMASQQGEMLFTHFGLSGPIILALSNHDFKQADIVIDLKPALSFEQLDKRVQRDFAKYSNKDFKNALPDLLPQKLIPVIVELSGIDPVKKTNSILKEERLRLVELLKNLPIAITDKRPFKEAIVTIGGLELKEVDPKTMESKLFPGLFVAGEMLDISGYTGGYNLQAAFSTGYLAGISAACKLR